MGSFERWPNIGENMANGLNEEKLEKKLQKCLHVWLLHMRRKCTGSYKSGETSMTVPNKPL